MGVPRNEPARLIGVEKSGVAAREMIPPRPPPPPLLLLELPLLPLLLAPTTMMAAGFTELGCFSVMS